MCELLIKSATISDSNSIYFVPTTDERWDRMNLNGEVVSDWGTDYEKEYRSLMDKLLIAGVATSKGNALSNSVFLAGLATLSNMAYYSINKELGMAEAEKFMRIPTIKQARGVHNLYRYGMCLKRITCSLY
jgi:hypothetical protein